MNRRARAVAVLLASTTLAAVALAGDEASAILGMLAAERAERVQPIEGPPEAMAAFYLALARTAVKRPGAVTRIAHFGDSLVEMELLPGPARRLLQQRWGDAGHGFVLPSRPKPWYRPHDLFFDPQTEWICLDMHAREPRDRRFGLGGAYGLAYKKNAEVEFGTVKKGPVGTGVSRFEILFPLEPEGGPVRVLVDGEERGVLDTASPAYRDAYAVVEVPDGPHRLALRALRERIRLHGVILERGGPGVVYDALGINGSGVNTYLSADEAHWTDQLRHRRPDLVILGIGTNDTFPELDLEDYARQVHKLIRRAKDAVPAASILWMAPLDRAMKQGVALVTNPMTPRIVATQRRVAAEAGIAFWSAFDAMGGEGSMARWYNAQPRLGAGDFFHPTPEGGEVLARMFYGALMQGFAAYLEKHGIPAVAPECPPTPLTRVELQK